MICEYGSCKCSGHDYVNPNPKKGWEGEPVYLCENHAKELKCTELYKKED